MFRYIDGGVLTAWILIAVSVIVCVVYGILNWNKGGLVTNQEAKEESRWENKEKEIDEELGG